MQIKDLAQASGLSIYTIRFYEKQGLLDVQHIRRQKNNYRNFLPGAVERLKLIGQAQAAGFTLIEIRALIQYWERETLSTQEKRVMFEQKIAQIDQQITRLESIRAYLQSKLTTLPN